MKFTKILLVLAITLFVTFTSCKKSDADLLVGKWEGNEFYTNGELSPYNNIFTAFTIEFNADGTGTYTGLTEQPLTWTFNEDTKALHIQTETVHPDTNTTIYGDTIHAVVKIIDNEELRYEYIDDTDTNELYWLRADK